MRHLSVRADLAQQDRFGVRGSGGQPVQACRRTLLGRLCGLLIFGIHQAMDAVHVMCTWCPVLPGCDCEYQMSKLRLPVRVAKETFAEAECLRPITVYMPSTEAFTCPQRSDQVS